MSLMGLCIFSQNVNAALGPLQAPVRQLNTDVFNWMLVAQIVAIAVGIVLGVAKGSVMPLSVGAGITLGGEFLKTWVAAHIGAAGCLI
jgi:hypothetical protein